MTRARLFGYSVDEDDGKLLITIDGLLAETAIRQIRDNAQTGKGGQLLSQLLPISSVHKLMSVEEKPQDEVLTLEQILGQNVDQSFSAFEEQLADLKASISTLNSPEGATEE
ncbi:MAG: hypothetical protein KME13_22175 [Myxacorys californica WJT36-NPBG1]|jgi:hypothetical protein|nr:hypothetical protein [Myxacorys californica WJT36-NPBG1]